jgi:hypothetical protein
MNEMDDSESFENFPNPCFDRTRAGWKRRNPERDVDSVKRQHKCGDSFVKSEQDVSWIGAFFVVETDETEIQPPLNNRSCAATPPAADGGQELLSEVISNVFSKLGQNDVEDDEISSLLGECSQYFTMESESGDYLQEFSGARIHGNEVPKCDRVLSTCHTRQSSHSANPVLLVQRDTNIKCPTTSSVHDPPGDNSSPPSGMSDLELTKFIINAVKKCEEPTLLTLTSFPFRVLYANNAYQTMTGNDIIGKTFYDIFVKEGKEGPSFGACPSLVGKFQQAIMRVQSSSKKGGIYSTIQIRPILKTTADSESGLVYYSVTLEPVEVLPNGASSIIYLPMPSGSMVTF